jgi:hypothetical protein
VVVIPSGSVRVSICPAALYVLVVVGLLETLLAGVTVDTSSPAES